MNNPADETTDEFVHFRDLMYTMLSLYGRDDDAHLMVSIEDAKDYIRLFVHYKPEFLTDQAMSIQAAKKVIELHEHQHTEVLPTSFKKNKDDGAGIEESIDDNESYHQRVGARTVLRDARDRHRVLQ